jgi:sulfatase modifying factor 1
MKVKFSALLAIPVLAFLLAGCSKRGGGQVSSTTGWDYNEAENGGFEVISGSEQETGPGLVLIEGGTFSMGRVEQDVTYDWNNAPRRVTVSSFYMDQTEVKNVDYREYLHWISRVFIDYPLVYKKALPSCIPAVWRRPMAYNEPYVQYYFRHPSYNDYPVVGVSWLQASDYCAWRTDRVNEGVLIREGILKPDPNQLEKENFNTESYLAGQYEGLVNQNLRSIDPNQEFRRVKIEDGMLLPKYRLPTEAEWEYAALSLIGNTYEERVYERRIYPWDGHNLRNDAKAYRGEMRANFVRGRGDMMGTAGSLNDNASIPGPVESFWPNDYGLYCMAGNVNEWVLDVYRPMTSYDVDEFNPFRGNVFQTLETDEEGNIAEKDSLGRLRYRDVTEEEAINRWNYKKAYYKNYKDGDYESSLIDGNEWTADMKGQASNSNRMYSQTPGFETSLVSDKSRVYKGGSWRDRAYWLSPGTRRFLDEEQSRDDLGFRCAMIRVGSPSGQGKKK